MNKEGHIGIVMNTNQPIKKVEKVNINLERKSSIDITPQIGVNRNNRVFNHETHLSLQNVTPYQRQTITQIQDGTSPGRQ